MCPMKYTYLKNLIACMYVHVPSEIYLPYQMFDCMYICARGGMIFEYWICSNVTQHSNMLLPI